MARVATTKGRAQSERGIAAVLLLAALSLIVCLCLAGCGRQTQEQPPSNDKGSTISDPKVTVEDLPFTVEDDGRLALSFTNESDYDILETDFTFTATDEVEDEEVLEAYEGMGYENYKNKYRLLFDVRIEMVSSSMEGLVKVGESSDPKPLELASYTGLLVSKERYLDEMAQFEVLSLAKAEISYVEDGLLYKEAYDAAEDAYSLDSPAIDVAHLPDNKLARTIPDPPGGYIIDTSGGDDYFSFDVIGMDESDYERYVAAVKEAGYTEDPFDGASMYSADSAATGYHISLDYQRDREKLDVQIDTYH